MIYDYPDLYDRLYGRFDEDSRFYLALARDELAGVADGEAIECCELACGTGRVGVALSQAGFFVYGVDASAAMLAAARRRFEEAGVPTDRYALQHADMRSFVLPARFALVIAPLHSLSHLLTTDDVLRCFAAVQASLREGGCFAFAVHNPDPIVLSRDSDSLFRVPFPVEEIAVYESCAYDAVAQVLHLTWYIESRDETESFPFALRMFFPQELSSLLEHAGFTIEERYGWYDRSPFTSESGTQLVVARKRRGAGAPASSVR